MHPKQKHVAKYIKNLTIFCEYESLRGNSFIINYYHSFAEGIDPHTKTKTLNSIGNTHTKM